MELDLHCPRCRLCRSRTRVVPPGGDLSSPVCLVGEAPGRQEDAEGTPFVGRAGKMLDRLLNGEGVPRHRLMITNTVKCRPPDNRAPRADERDACFPYLEQELAGRRLVVGMGRTACRSLLGREVKLGDEANILTEVQIMGTRVPFLPTYHPSACLFNLTARKGLREAIRRIRDEFLDLD